MSVGRILLVIFVTGLLCLVIWIKRELTRQRERRELFARIDRAIGIDVFFKATFSVASFSELVDLISQADPDFSRDISSEKGRKKFVECTEFLHLIVSNEGIAVNEATAADKIRSRLGI